MMPVFVAAAAAADFPGSEPIQSADDGDIVPTSCVIVVVRSVHGPVAYWDGKTWARLRPNLVFSNTPSIRPGPDSSVDLSAGNDIALRMVTDRALKVTAVVVKHSTSARFGDPGAESPNSPLVVKIQAGSIARGPGEIEFTVLANADVVVSAGEVTVTGDGKPHLLEDGSCFEANTGEARRLTAPKLRDSAAASAKILSCSVVSAPQPVLFAGGLENARRGAYLAGR
jgi:hypothetical protein